MAVHNKSGEKPIITPKGCPKIDLSLLEASPSRDHHGSEKPVWAMGQRNLYGLWVRETRMGYGSEKPVWATGTGLPGMGPGCDIATLLHFAKHSPTWTMLCGCNL
jgi:hypothetical protein